MIYEKVIEYCESNHIPISAFEKECNIGNGTIGKWKENRSIPSLKTLSKIEKQTGIPIDYWIRGGQR